MVKKLKEKQKIEIHNDDGELVEVYSEVLGEEFSERLKLVEKELYQQAEDLKRMESSIYESEASKFLEFNEEDLLSGNDVYQDQQATLNLFKRATEAFLKAEEPIDEFGIYIEDVMKYFKKLNEYTLNLGATVEEGMSYFISDKNQLRAIPSNSISMAKIVMELEVEKGILEDKKKLTKEKSTMYI